MLEIKIHLVHGRVLDVAMLRAVTCFYCICPITFIRILLGTTVCCLARFYVAMDPRRDYFSLAACASCFAS